MKCPWCNNEMTDGFINSARKIFFSKNQNDGFIFIAGKQAVALTQHNWTRPSAKAYHCENCKRVVVDYDVEIE